jgi:hypothetical protein
MTGASSRWCLLLVHYPGHASHRVAADPDVVNNLADVDPATPADDGSDRAQCLQAGRLSAVQLSVRYFRWCALRRSGHGTHVEWFQCALEAAAPHPSGLRH